MSITGISAYSQIQNWHAKQKAATDNLIGSSSDLGSGGDFSSAFTNVAANAYAGAATITAQATISRTASKLQLLSSQGNVSSDFGANAAKSAGNAILSQLGYSGFGANTASSTNYAAPVNYSTGKAYVKTSGAALNNLSSLSLFA